MENQEFKIGEQVARVDDTHDKTTYIIREIVHVNTTNVWAWIESQSIGNKAFDFSNGWIRTSDIYHIILPMKHYSKSNYLEFDKKVTLNV